MMFCPPPLGETPMATLLAKEPTFSSRCGTFTGVILDLCWAGDRESVCSANLVCSSIVEES